MTRSGFRHFVLCGVLLAGCVERSRHAGEPTNAAALRCTTPAEGCACNGNQPPIPCRPEGTADAGAGVCEEGTRYCRNGRFGACENVVSYPAKAQPASQPNALVDPVAKHPQCSDCEPICFRVTDNFDPADGPLDGGIASGVTFHTSGAGVTLVPNMTVGMLPQPDGGVPDGSLYIPIPEGLTGSAVNLAGVNPGNGQIYLLLDQSRTMAEATQYLYDDFDQGSLIDGGAVCTGGDSTLLDAGIAGALRCLTRDPSVGVGMFRDIPFDPYAYDDSLTPALAEADSKREIAYANIESQNPDLSQARAALMRLGAPESSGHPDIAGSQIPALHAVATGQGMFTGLDRSIVLDADCASGTFGYPCFPSGAQPIVIMVTDAPFHNGPDPASYPYEYDAANLGALAGTMPGVLRVPLAANDWPGAYRVTTDAASTLSVLSGTSTAMTPLISPNAVGCGASPSAGDSVIRFDVSGSGSGTSRVSLSTEQSGFDTALSVFDGLVLPVQNLPAADQTNEQFSSAYTIGDVTEREIVVQGSTSMPATMKADYQSSLFGGSCDAATTAPDAAFSFNVAASAAPTKLDLSLSMGASYPVLSVYEQGTNLPLWPAFVAPIAASGNRDAYPADAFSIPTGAGNEYLSISGTTTGMGADYDMNVLGGSACHSTSGAPDVGFKIHLDAPHRMRFDTEGSSFDTTLSLHSAPPPSLAGNIINATNTNETAASAMALSTINGQHVIVHGDTAAMNPDVTDTFGCGMDNACADAVFTIDVSQRTTVRFKTTGTGYQPALVVTRQDPALVSGRYAAIALGENHSCALSGGKAYCWGADDQGQLGNGGAAGDPDSLSAVQVNGVTSAVQVAAGRNHGCVVTSTGGIACWGAGAAGQLGDGNASDRYAPVGVLDVGGGGPIADAIQVACGNAHCCALRTSGAALCWGDNSQGQLGDGGAESGSSTPVAVTSGSDRFEQIAANGDHTCALRVSDKAVLCWGDGSHGAMGNGSTANNPTPMPVMGVASALSVMVGVNHACAVQADGHVACWGRGDSGQLGHGGDDLNDHSSAVLVLGPDSMPLTDARGSFAAGTAHTCTNQLSGLVMCWGGNAQGQLGDGGNTLSALAESAYDILDATQVVSSATHTCALRRAGGMLCFGDGAHGKLGTGGTASALRALPALPGTPEVAFGTGALDVGFTRACGGVAQPPDPSCRPGQQGGQSYFFCTGNPRTFAGAGQNCARVGYALTLIDSVGENAFVASQLAAPSWLGVKRSSSPDWLTLDPGLDFTDLNGNKVWHTEVIGHDDCPMGMPPCTFVPTSGFFVHPPAALDLVDSETSWSAASTWAADDEPKPDPPLAAPPPRYCTLIDPAGKWSTADCASGDPAAPWETDPAALVSGSIAGTYAAPGFAAGEPHDYSCELNLPFRDVTLDPGRYFVTVKGSDNGVPADVCSGAYTLDVQDLGSPGGGLLVCNDDEDDESSASAIERNLNAGDYYLVLKGWKDSDGGAYRLTVRDVGASSVQEIACDRGTGPGDPAKVSFTAQPGKSYYALVKGDTPADQGAYTLDVRDTGATGSLVQCDAGSGPGGASKLDLDLSPGTYYAIVTGRGTDDGGNYVLTLGGASPVPASFTPPSYDDTIAALTAAHVRVGTVLNCDPSQPSCADAQAQAGLLSQATRGVVRMAPNAADVPSQVIAAVQVLESLDSVTAQLVFAPDANPGFLNPNVSALADPSGRCTLASNGVSFAPCTAGAGASFQVSLTNPALQPVPPAPGPLGVYTFTLHITGTRDGDTVLDRNVPVLVAPTGAAPPMTYTTGSYYQDFSAKSCRGNTRPSWDSLTADVDVRPDTRVVASVCTADNLGDLGSCDSGVPSSGYKRALTITAGSGSGTPCTVATQTQDCPDGYCSPYTSVCNYLEGAACTQDTDCPGVTAGRCRPGPSAATLGYTCRVLNSAADPSSALVGDNYRTAMRVRFQLDSFGDGSRTPSVFFWEAQYRCRTVE